MNPEVIVPAAIIASVAAVAAYGAANPRSQLFGPSISRTGSPRRLAITFDDGPNPAVTPKLLGLLDRHHVRATFFAIGRFARECPELLREISAQGHEVGNHTETHPNLLFLGPAQIREELRLCHEAISNVLNTAPKWFRPPFGWRNPWLHGAVGEFHLRVVTWTLLPGDWRAPSDEWLIRRIEPIASRAKANVDGRARDHGERGDILCLHDGGYRRQNSDRTHTLAALEYWLPRWRDLGLEFATIEEAVGLPAQ